MEGRPLGDRRGDGDNPELHGRHGWSDSTAPRTNTSEGTGTLDEAGGAEFIDAVRGHAADRDSGADAGGPDGDDSDAELVVRAIAGDLTAFDSLVRRYQEIAFRTAYVVSGGSAEAEDAVQEAFVKAHAALPRFRRDAPFRPWLLTIVANEARNRRRSASRRTALALRAGPDRASGEAAPSPEAAVLADESRRELLAAIEQLRDEDRLVVTCRYLLQLSEAETAAALACPTGTVKSRLSRALGRLRLEMRAATPQTGRPLDG